MAYQSTKLQDPKWKKTTKLRTKNQDQMTKELKLAANYNPWVSMYSAEYSKEGRNKIIKEKPDPISYKKYSNWQSAKDGFKKNNFMGTDVNNLRELNDAISTKTFEVRGEPIKRMTEYNDYDTNPNRNKAMKSNMKKSLVKNNRSTANLNNSNLDNQKAALTIVSHNSNANIRGSQQGVAYVGKGHNPFENSVKNKSSLMKKNRPTTALANSASQKNKFFAAGAVSPREYERSPNSRSYMMTSNDKMPSGSRKAINLMIKPKLDSHKIDSLALHFNKKTKILNHPHHNFNGYGQAGDWGTMNKNTFNPENKYDAEEPIPAHRDKVGIRRIEKPMCKESQYHNDYPNWGKIPKSVN